MLPLDPLMLMLVALSSMSTSSIVIAMRVSFQPQLDRRFVLRKSVCREESL
jgi:hypothetical protein